MNTQIFFGAFPEFDLGDIVLREIEYEDASGYLNYMNRPEMLDFLTKEHIPNTLEKALEELQYWGSLFPTKRSIYWAIALKSNNLIIGTAGFNHFSFSNSKSEISYDLSPDYWGKGVMLKSLKHILKFAENNLQVVRVQATVTIDNNNSIKLLERCGFEREGYMKRITILRSLSTCICLSTHPYHIPAS